MKRELQIATAAAGVLPVGLGIWGVFALQFPVDGASVQAKDFDFIFRYTSSLLFGLGIAFWAAIRSIERKKQTFRVLAVIVAAGAIARAYDCLAKWDGFSKYLLLWLSADLCVFFALNFAQANVARELAPRREDKPAGSHVISKPHKRGLQAAIAIAGVFPVLAGLFGVLADLTDGSTPAGAFDHLFRYLSGLWLGIGLAFWSAIPAVERKGETMRALTAIVVAGAFARIYGCAAACRELSEILNLSWIWADAGVALVLCVWQARLERALLPAG
jgi:hypothetical protein